MTQGNMFPLGQLAHEEKKQRQDISPGGLAEDEDKNPMNQYLSDHTMIGGQSWKQLRPIAMSIDLSQKKWYIDLKPSQKKRLEALRCAQHRQGDGKELKEQPYNKLINENLANLDEEYQVEQEEK